MAQNIDYSRQKKSTTFNKNQLLSKLNINRKDRFELDRQLTNQKAIYDDNTVELANNLLGVLADQGIDYKLIARNDGGGILAQTRGLGGDNLVITVANQYYEKNGKMVSGNKNIGNIVTSNMNFYLSNSTLGLVDLTSHIRKNNIEKGTSEYKRLWAKYFQSPEYKSFQEESYSYVLKALTGNQPIEVSQANRKDVQYDIAFTIYDDQKRPITRAYGRKTGRNDNLEKNLENDNQSNLLNLVEQTNQYINEQLNDNNELLIDNNGIEETVQVNPIEIQDSNTLEGLNLDTLLLINKNSRNEISELVNEELKNNPQFSLDNEGVIAEEGFKNILAEQSAGTRAEKLELNPNEDQAYIDILNNAKNYLTEYGIDVEDIYLDSDYVMHWQGKNRTDEKQRSGEIGQLFIPDQQGVLETHFKTIEGSENRNYSMVPGYMAYYKSEQKTTTVIPQTIGIEDQNGNTIDVVASTARDEQGHLIPFKNNKGQLIRPERLPEDTLLALNKQIEQYNENQTANNQLPLIATETRTSTLKDRLRLKGYHQLLDQQLKSVLAKQVILSNSHANNNYSLNKLYHGDTYGMRIDEHTRQKPNAIRTLSQRVKFKDDVLNMSANELDEDFDGKHQDYEGDDYSHRFNIKALDGLFDRSVSTDGQNLGLIRYLTKQAKVLPTGEIVASRFSDIDRAAIIDDIPFSFGDPGDRSMMASNQAMKARNISQQRVALMTYKGYTFEDGSVVSEKFAKEQGAIVNGYDEHGGPIPLEVGDKISDLHGNKSTISYIAQPDDDVFKDNPQLDVIMNPYSVSSRKNTGLLLEMKHQGDMVPVKMDGQTIAESGLLNVVVTDITAKDKTKTYQAERDESGNYIPSSRLGRSFGVQEAWVANALELNDTMDEIYGRNDRTFEKLKAYMNVTGLDFDQETMIIESNGFNNGKKEPENSVKVPLKEPIELPTSGGYIELPIEVELTSGMSTKYLNVLPEKFRESQSLYAGELIYHEYTNQYANIIKTALKPLKHEQQFKVELENTFDNLQEQDLTQYDLRQPEDQNKLKSLLSNPKDLEELNEQLKKFNTEKLSIDNSLERQLQSQVNSLTNNIIEDHLGGRSKLVEYTDEYGDTHLKRHKNSQAIKRSIIKREIMGKQVPNSVTSVVTAEPNVDINTIRVSEEIYATLDLKNDDDRVLLWRDPALHDGSMRAFKVEKDDNIVGVGINPLVTESFGMDFDGDTVGVYAPKTKEAQLELKNKASIEANLIDATSKEFSGNISMDLVSGAINNSQVILENNHNDLQGPIKDKIDDERYKGKSPKEQISLVLTDLAQEENGWEKINDYWKDNVTSDKCIATADIPFSDRNKTKEALVKIAASGAKGKVKDIYDESIESKLNEKSEELGRPITYKERMEDPQNLLSDQSTILDYYDRAEEMNHYQKEVKQGNKKALADYEQLYRPYNEIKKTDGTIIKEVNHGSLSHDQDKTRMAQSGKTDLTGLAGAKSQNLVSLMYDQPNGAQSAMEVTEPLTQATLKLKHDPKQTPEIKNLFKDYDEMLDKGGYTEQEFLSEFKTMYSKVGLDVRDEHLKEVFNTLSIDENGERQTQPIQNVMEDRMQPLMKANLYGYDVLKEAANGQQKEVIMDKGVRKTQVKDYENSWVDLEQKIITNGNNDYLKLKALGKDDYTKKIEPQKLKNGDKSQHHIPKNLEKVTMSSRERVAESIALKKQNEVEVDNEKMRTKKMEHSPEINTPKKSLARRKDVEMEMS